MKNSQASFNTNDYALYLPAVNKIYAEGAQKDLEKNRPFPEGISVSDLQFWRCDNALFYYPYALHSVGQYTVGSNFQNSLALTRAEYTTLIGDSGGFQLGKGTFKGCMELDTASNCRDAVKAWRDSDGAYFAKKWVIDFLDTFFDYSMTIDIPLWTTFEKENQLAKFRDCTIEQITQLSVENLKFIEDHSTYQTKWLNVIQGLDWATTKYWWDSVKFFNCSGYALAGGAGGFGGLAQLLKTALLIRDEAPYANQVEWIHVLGVSTPPLAIMLTAIQRNLRKKFPLVKLSFDSASPFQTGGRNETPTYTKNLNKNLSSWTISHGDSLSVHGSHLVNSSEKFPYDSALGDVLKLSHLNVNTKRNAKRNFDTLSNLLLVNHNIWTYLKIFEMANDAAFKDDARLQVPDKFCAALDLIDTAFDVNDWEGFIDKNADAFNAISKNSYVQ
jgi:hypothetical protein